MCDSTGGDALTIGKRGGTLATALNIAIEAWAKDAAAMREVAAEQPTESGRVGYTRLAEQFDRQQVEAVAMLQDLGNMGVC